MIEVPLNLNVGHGWRALRARIPERSSSIVLVTLGHNSTEQHVRLDVDKRIIIDESPAKIDTPSVDRIVKRVVAARSVPQTPKR